MSGREQQQSKLPKRGPTKSHEKAKDRMVVAMMDTGWEVLPDAVLACTWGLKSQNNTLLRPSPDEYTRGYYHEYDIYAFKWHDNGLQSEIIIEIDGKVHNSNQQRSRDIRAANYAAFFLPDARFIRMPIELLLNKNISDKAILEEYKIK